MARMDISHDCTKITCRSLDSLDRGLCHWRHEISQPIRGSTLSFSSIQLKLSATDSEPNGGVMTLLLGAAAANQDSRLLRLWHAGLRLQQWIHTPAITTTDGDIFPTESRLLYRVSVPQTLVRFVWDVLASGCGTRKWAKTGEVTQDITGPKQLRLCRLLLRAAKSPGTDSNHSVIDFSCGQAAIGRYKSASMLHA